jgi:hypothetical protein
VCLRYVWILDARVTCLCDVIWRYVNNVSVVTTQWVVTWQKLACGKLIIICSSIVWQSAVTDLFRVQCRLTLWLSKCSSYSNPRGWSLVRSKFLPSVSCENCGNVGLATPEACMNSGWRAIIRAGKLTVQRSATIRSVADVTVKFLVCANGWFFTSFACVLCWCVGFWRPSRLCRNWNLVINCAIRLHNCSITVST